MIYTKTMRRILRKRFFSTLIDAFVFAFAFEFCRFFIPPFAWLFKQGIWMYMIVMIPYLYKDALFRNASLGKKIMGLAIYCSDWSYPSVTVLIKRLLWFCMRGNWIVSKAQVLDKNHYAQLFIEEKERLGTRVVETKALNRFKNEAMTETGVDFKKLSVLYDEFLER